MEIDNFVIKSDICFGFFICKNISKKLSCYHDNYFKYLMFGKYKDLCQQGEGFCMHVLKTVAINGRLVLLCFSRVPDFVYQ
jgi:hypothetical protein